MNSTVTNRQVPRRKLLVTASTFPRFAEDSEPRFILDLCKSLSAYFDVTVLVPADRDAPIVSDLEGVHVVRYRYAPVRAWERLAYPGAIMPRLKAHPLYWLLVPLLFLGLYRALRAELRHRDFDCVHVHWLLPQGVVQSLIVGRHAPQFVVTSHGGDIHTFNNKIFARIYRWVFGKAAAVTVVSDQIRKKMLAKMDLSTEAAARIDVIPMGVDINKFGVEHRRLEWAASQGLNRPVFLFVGRIAEKKGLKYLIHAFSLEPLKAKVSSLAIVGDGPLREELEVYAHSLGVGGNVRFLGPASHEQLKTIYASADVFCVPSIVAEDGDEEGLPTVLMEAAASGLPSIATKTGGIPEIVKHNETGWLVPQKDSHAIMAACMAYIQHPVMREEHGRAAHLLAAHYSWENIGRRYGQVIDRALSSVQQ